MMLRKPKVRTRQRPSRQKQSAPVRYYSASAENNSKTNQSPFRSPYFRGGGWRERLFDLIIFTVAVLAAYGLFVVRSPAEVLVGSEVYRPAADYGSAVNEQLAAVNYKNKITFEEDKLKQAIVKQFPEISDINVKLPLFSSRPVIQLEMYQPAILLKSQNQQFIVDSRGRAVGLAENYPHIDNLITLDDQSGFGVETDKLVLSSQSVGFIQTLHAHLKSKNIPLQSLELPNRPQELILRTKDKKYFVKFNLGGDPSTQIGQWLAVREDFQKNNTNPAQYLDVRVQGRVFYK